MSVQPEQQHMNGEQQVDPQAAEAHRVLVEHLRQEGAALRSIKIPNPLLDEGKPEDWQDWSYMLMLITWKSCTRGLGRH